MVAHETPKAGRDPMRHAWTEDHLISAASSVVTLQYAAPNVYGLGGGESDLLGVTRAGMVYEFEAKLTLSDLRADLNGSVLSNKWCRHEVMRALHAGGPPLLGWAHDFDRPAWAAKSARPVTDPDEWAELNRAGHRRKEMPYRAPIAPHHFYFVYPRECGEAFDALVPAYAGIAHAYVSESYYGPEIYADVVRKAPRLHGDKSKRERVERAILVSTYHRYWELRRARRDEAAA